MRTTIPIPRVRRKFYDENGSSIIVMDYIPGERLDHVWPSLSLWSKLWVALTLRRYVRQLRQINSSVPGSVADSPQTCHSSLFQKPCGPFPDYASLSAFFNRKLDIAKSITFPDDHGNQILAPILTASLLMTQCRLSLPIKTSSCATLFWGRMEKFGWWIGVCRGFTRRGLNMSRWCMRRKDVRLRSRGIFSFHSLRIRFSSI